MLEQFKTRTHYDYFGGNPEITNNYVVGTTQFNNRTGDLWTCVDDTPDKNVQINQNKQVLSDYFAIWIPLDNLSGTATTVNLLNISLYFNGAYLLVNNSKFNTFSRCIKFTDNYFDYGSIASANANDFILDTTEYKISGNFNLETPYEELTQIIGKGVIDLEYETNVQNLLYNDTSGTLIYREYNDTTSTSVIVGDVTTYTSYYFEIIKINDELKLSIYDQAGILLNSSTVPAPYLMRYVEGANFYIGAVSGRYGCIASYSNIKIYKK